MRTVNDEIVNLGVAGSSPVGRPILTEVNILGVPPVYPFFRPPSPEIPRSRKPRTSCASLAGDRGLQRGGESR